MTPLPLPAGLSTDILVYVALSEEFDAVKAELSVPLEPISLEGISLIGYRGEISTNTASYQLVIVPAGRMGNSRSAAIASVLIAEFKPQTLVVLGIAGSMSNDLQLGDVFLPESVKEFLANSSAEGDGKDWKLQLSGNEIPSFGQILNKFQNLKHTNTEMFVAWQDRTKALSDKFVTKVVREDLRKEGISFEACAQLKAGEDRKLASGPIVGKGEEFSSWLKEFSDRKFAAIEMESAGVYDACQLRIAPPKVIAIRGISDFADERKAKIQKFAGTGFRELAARNATAAFLCAIRSGVFAKKSKAETAPPSDNFYPPLIEWIDRAFRLNNWNNYCDLMIRGMVPYFFEEAANDLAAFVFRANWPQSFPNLNDAVLNLNTQTLNFTSFYMKHARLSPFGDDMYRRDHFYDRLPYGSPQKHQAAQLFDLWSSTCIAFLSNIVVALNRFAEEVSKSLDPEFRRLSGKFVLRDAQGIWEPSNLESTDYLPAEYYDSKALLNKFTEQEAALAGHLATQSE